MLYQYTHPEEINNYPKQLQFIEAPERYVIIEATTKAGKTTGCLVWLFEQALNGKPGKNYWWVAPVRSQAKMVFDRLRLYVEDKQLITTNKSELTITLFNGATIFFKSADRPDLIYGDDVMAVVIDEASRMKEEAWYAIRSTLTKTRGYVKIIGNVKGTNNWVYHLARQAEAGNLKDWRYFKITADDAVHAGILQQQSIDEAKDALPTGVFLELYYGIPNQNSSTKFCYAFDEKKHVGKCQVNHNAPIYLSFDFNHNPICCSVIQYYNNTVWVPHCFKLQNSNIFQLCQLIRTKFPHAHFVVTGDASGNSHSAYAQDSNTCYSIIQQQLNVNLGQFRVPRSNPPLHKNQILVNAILEKHRVQIDPDNAAALIMDFKFVEINPDGTIKKTNRNNPTQQADLLDTFRYFCNSCMSQYFPIDRYM
ncbi:MAG: phage terminase large subunit [Bacteroidota bacterium]|nr:phage terminase large subunit [Bacteroidota bacterium]